MRHCAVYVVDGSWGSWGEWSTCDVSCGGGLRTRRRLCDSPRPSDAGQLCQGDDLQTDACMHEHCPGTYNTDCTVID